VVRITLATIKGSEFTAYWRGIQSEELSPTAYGRQLTRNEKAAANFRELREADQRDLGWVREENRDQHAPEVLEHRYFRVVHNRVVIDRSPC
jgi:hypothetical protein